MALSTTELAHIRDRARLMAAGLPPPTAEQRSNIEAAVTLYRDTVESESAGDAA